MQRQQRAGAGREMISGLYAKIANYPVPRDESVRQRVTLGRGRSVAISRISYNFVHAELIADLRSVLQSRGAGEFQRSYAADSSRCEEIKNAECSQFISDFNTAIVYWRHKWHSRVNVKKKALMADLASIKLNTDFFTQNAEYYSQ